MIERVIGLIRQSGLTEKSFALKIGVPQNTLNTQLSGVRKLSLATIVAIINAFPEISLDWLLKNEGPMMKSDAIKQFDMSDKLLSLTSTIATLQNLLDEKNKIIETLMNK